MIAPVPPAAAVLYSKPPHPGHHGDRKDLAIHAWPPEKVVVWDSYKKEDEGRGETPISVQKYVNGTKKPNAPPLEANKLLPGSKSSMA